MGFVHEADDAYLIQSTWLAGPIADTSNQYLEFVEIFNISLDLCNIYFAYFSGGLASFCMAVDLS